MGLLSFPDHRSARDDFSTDAFKRAMHTVRRASPAWAWHAPAFEGVAGECIASALKSFDSTRGVPFEAYLYMRAESRVPAMIARIDSNVRDLEVVPLTDAVIDSLPGVTDNVDTDDDLLGFLGTLAPRQRQIATAIAFGARPTDVAGKLGIGKQAVSNCLKDLRKKATAYYGDTATARYAA